MAKKRNKSLEEIFKGTGVNVSSTQPTSVAQQNQAIQKQGSWGSTGSGTGGTRIVGTGGGVVPHTDAGAQKVASLSGSKYSGAGAVVDAFSRVVGNKTTKTNNAATAFKPAPVMSKPKQTKQDRLATVSAELDAMRNQRTQLVKDSVGKKAQTQKITELNSKIQKAKDEQKKLEKEVYGYTGNFFTDNAKRIGRTLSGATQSVAGTAAETVGQIGRLGTDADDARMYATLGSMINEERNPGSLQRQQRAAQARTQSLFDTSDRFAEESAQNIESAKGGLGAVGKLAVDVTSEGLKLAGDMALNTVAPGSGLAAMGVRAFGSGAQQARQAGATGDRQFLYGATTAGIEMLTEKMFSAALPFKKAYGGAARIGGKTLDDAMDAVIGKVIKNPTVQMLAHNFMGEWLEEDMSDILNPVAQLIYDQDAVKNTYGTAEGRRQLAEDLLRDGLIGGILGALGATGNVVSNTAVGNRLMKNGGSGAANVLATAASFPEQSEAHKSATELIERHDKGGKITAYELGDLVHQMQEAAAHGVYPDENGGSYEVVRDARGNWQVVHQINETAQALNEKGVDTKEAIKYAAVLDSLAQSDDLSASQVKRKLDVFSPAVREQVEEMTGRTLPEPTTKAESAREIKAAFDAYREERAEEERIQEEQAQAAAQAEEQAAIAEQSDAEAAQFMEQAVAEQEQALAQEQAQQQPQRQPRESREQFIERKKAESMSRYGIEPTDKQLEAAWRASTEQDGVLLDDGTVIGRAEFYEVMRPYLSAEEGYELSDEQMEAAYNRFRTISDSQPIPRAVWEQSVAATRGDTSAQPESVAAEETAAEESAETTGETAEAEANKTSAAASKVRDDFLQKSGQSVPTKEEVASGTASWHGIPIVYTPNAHYEAENLTTEIRVSDKLFDLDIEGQRNVLNHEAAHNISDEMIQSEDWETLSGIFLKRTPISKEAAQRARAARLNVFEDESGQPFVYEGLQGELGSNAILESTTDAINAWFNNPAWLKENHEEAYNFITDFMAKRMERAEETSPVEETPVEEPAATVMSVAEESAPVEEPTPVAEEKPAEKTPSQQTGTSQKKQTVIPTKAEAEAAKTTTQSAETAPKAKAASATDKVRLDNEAELASLTAIRKVVDSNVSGEELLKMSNQANKEFSALERSVKGDFTPEQERKSTDLFNQFIYYRDASRNQPGNRGGVLGQLDAEIARLQSKVGTAANKTTRKGGVKHSLSSNPNIQTNENVTLEQRLAAEFLMEHLQSKGIKGIVFDGKNLEGENGHIDKKSGIVYLNENYLDTAMAVAQTVGHEIFHAGVEGDAQLVNSMLESAKKLVDEGKLTGRNGYRAARWLNDIDAEVERRAADYRAFLEAAGADEATIAEETSPEAMREEIACDLMGMVLNNQSALDTIAGENPTLLDRIIEALDRLLGGRYSRMANYATGGEDTSFAQYGKEYADTVKEFDKIAERLSTALDNYRDNRQQTDSEKYSVSSVFEAAGLKADRTEDGIIKVYDKNGKPVKKVTPEMVNDSMLGAMINFAATGIERRDKKGNLKFFSPPTITPEQAQEQINAAAELLDMMLDAQDGALVWNFAGASMFSAVKANSDGQYGITIDFSTVCRKTRKMMQAMSKAMMDLGRGLTKEEVIEIQGDIITEGGEVNCPVCYVFSRWAGVGGILQNIKEFQEKYGREYDDDAKLSEAIETLEQRVAEKEDLRAALMENDTTYRDLSADIEENKQKLQDARAKKRAAQKDPNVSQKEIDAIDKEIDRRVKDNDKMRRALRKIESDSTPELAWLKRVRAVPDGKGGWKSNPKYWNGGFVGTKSKNGRYVTDIKTLFDLENAADFVEKYPIAWAYRTSRGPSAGKAILPYSDMRIGDFILGPKSGHDTGNKTFADTTRGQFTRKQENRIKDAIRRVLAQNLIGGQRFQSTSDFRFDYGLDYLMAFWEAQAVGSTMQSYTKVPDFVHLAAAVGGDVNISMMPENSGVDENGHLVYSKVTGVDPEEAFRLNALYHNAQLILVGINDRHIAAALEDNTESGGAQVGFVIPYHASGASINEYISALLKNLGEDFQIEYYKDYSKLQTDSEKKVPDADKDVAKKWLDAMKRDPVNPGFGENAPNAEQRALLERKLRAEIRTAILTHKSSFLDSEGKKGNANEANAELLLDNTINLIRGENKDITDMSFEELSDIERRAMNGDEDAIREYESWSAGVLWNIYQKMWVDETAYDTYDVRLTSSQSKSIMPHEYWNKTVNRDKAYINGFIFRSYCHSLGLYPRFSGYTSAGTRMDYGDFTSTAQGISEDAQKGYWKLLIDRPMYDNNGVYREQNRINATDVLKITEEGSIDADLIGKDDPTLKEDEKAARAAAAFVKRDRERQKQKGIKHSLPTDTKQMDEEYMAAVESGNTARAQEMVDEAAKAAGYDIKAYHGTKADFTAFDKSRFGKNYGGFLKYGDGFYFALNNKSAERWAGKAKAEGEPRVIPVFLSSNRMLNVNDPVDNPAAVEYLKSIGTGKADINWYLTTGYRFIESVKYHEGQDGIQKVLESLGYDGIADTLSSEHGQYVVFNPEQVKSSDPVTYDKDGNVIPLSERFRTDRTGEDEWKNRDIRYSIRHPVEGMYNLSERVIDGMKQDKFGAASVVNMLRGKGVKAEEIKWLGIEDFLKGKKSVTKQELLDWIRANDLVIEEETLESDALIGNANERSYPDEWELVDVETGEVYSNASEAFEVLAEREGLDPDYIGFDESDGVYYEDPDSHDREILAEFTSDHYESEDGTQTADETRWSAYATPGGSNYREILFRMPNSDYSNSASETHWGNDAPGVLAHARVQTFDTADGDTVLFVDEIQSDWHNAGQQFGYYTGKEQKARRDSAEEEFLFGYDAALEMAQEAAAEIGMPREDVYYDERNGAFMVDYFNSPLELLSYAAQEEDTDARTAPDAPFKDSYTDFVLKRLLREAAENGYGGLAWTDSEMQMDRWNPLRELNKKGVPKFQEAYRNIYDRQVVKFLNKFGKKFGARVGTTEIIGEDGKLITVPYIPITDSMRESVVNEGTTKFSVAPARDLYQTEFDFTEPMTTDEFREKIKQENDTARYFPKGLSPEFMKAITSKALFAKPKLYRGIDAAEFDFIMENGFIKSNGSYNFSNQQDQTLADEDAGYALSYATGFAPREIADRHYKDGLPSYLIEFVNAPDLNVAKNDVQESYTYGNIDQKYITRVFEIMYDQESGKDMIQDVTDDIRAMRPELGSGLDGLSHGLPMFYRDKTTGTILYAVQGADGYETGGYISEKHPGMVIQYEDIGKYFKPDMVQEYFGISGNEADLEPMVIEKNGELATTSDSNANAPVSAFTEKGRKYSVRGQVPEFDAIFDFYANYGLTNDAPKAPPKPQVSRVRSKTYERMGVSRSFDEEHRQALEESEFEYDPIAEQESMRRAEERLTNDYDGEKAELSKRNWRNGEDLDTAMGILATELNLAKETGDYDETIEWLHLIREQGTKAGQFIQAFAKYNRSPEGILARAVDDLEKSKLSSDERKELIEKITDFAATLSKLRPKADGSVNPNALVDLIVQQAKQRNTKVSKASMKVLQRLVDEGDVQYLYNFALTQLDQIAKDYIPASLGRKVGTYQTISHLLNLRTGSRNLFSNTLFGSVAATANNFAMVPDTLFSLITGSRTVGLDRGHFSKETWHGIKEGGARARLGINLDVQPDSNSRDKYGTSKRTWKMTGNFVQRQMSRVEKLMAYELNWTDEFRKGGVRAEIIQSLAPMVANGSITMEVAKEWAEQEALYRTFQDDTYVNKLLGNIKKLLNMKLVSEVDANGKKTYHIGQMDFGLGDIVQKYTQVPGALITRAIELSPAGYLKAIYLMGSMAQTARASKQAKTAYEVAKQTAEKSDKERLKRAANRAFEKSVKADVIAKSAQRDAALALGRAITGTGLIAAFAALAKMGLLKRADDEDDPDAKALKAAEGITGTQLNLSAIRRLINGESTEWRQGDILASVEFLEPMNNEMTMGAKIAKSIAGGKNDLGTFTLDTFDALYQSMQEIPTMQTLQTINQTVQYHKEDDPLPVWAEIPIEIARSGVTGFVPALVRQTAQASDPYYRDAYTSRNIGDQIKDTVKNAIPGLRQQLPVKLDNFGRPKEQESQPLNALNAFLIPGSVRTYQQSKATGKLQTLYDQTGKANIFPDRSAPYNVSYSVDKQQTKFDLSPEERQKYQTTRGQVTLKTLVAAMDNMWYQNASADQKVEIAEKAKAYGNYKAKVEADAKQAQREGRTDVYSDSEYEHIDTALNMGYNMASYLLVKSKCNSFSADKDANGKSISGSKMKKIISYLDSLNLTDQQKAYMFELTSGSNKTPFGSY